MNTLLKGILTTVALLSTPGLGATFDPRISVEEVTSQNQKVNLQLEVASAPIGSSLLQVEQGGVPISSELKQINENIWLLVDSSKLCESFGISKYLSLFFANLKRHYGPKTTISIVEYFSGEVRTRRLNETIDQAIGYQVQCQPNELSSSFEKALSSLIAQHKGTVSADRIWILSSGNVKISPEISQQLNQSSAQIYVGLYNPLLFQVVSDVLERQKLKSFSIWSEDQNTAMMPPYRTHIEFSVPEEKLDEKFEFQVRLLDGDKILASSNQSILVPSVGWRSFVKRNRMLLTLMTILLLTSLIGSILWKCLRLPRCRKCKEPARRDDPRCLDCHEGSYVLDLTENREKLHFFPENGLRIGSSRQADIRIHSPSKKRRVNYRIEKKRLKNGNDVCVLIPGHHKDKMPMKLNGVLVSQNRLVGNQDHITIDNKTFVLFTPHTQVTRRSKNAV